MSENLMDGLLNEIQRVTEIRQEYLTIPAGHFAAYVMLNSINNAKASISNGDVNAMLVCYEDLKSYE